MLAQDTCIDSLNSVSVKRKTKFVSADNFFLWTFNVSEINTLQIPLNRNFFLSPLLFLMTLEAQKFAFKDLS